MDSCSHLKGSSDGDVGGGGDVVFGGAGDVGDGVLLLGLGYCWVMVVVVTFLLVVVVKECFCRDGGKELY